MNETNDAPTIARRPVLGLTAMLQRDGENWQLLGLLPENRPPSGRPRHRIVREDGNSSIHQWQGLPLRLQPDQTDDYIYNITSRSPMLFLICTSDEQNRPVPLHVSADQDDGVAAIEVDEIVFESPMPGPVLGWIQAYVQAYWTPGPRKGKRRGGDRGAPQGSVKE